MAVLLFLITGGTFNSSYAQGTFNSGSTGADGAFAPGSSQTVQLPESGIFNFTTVNIPSGVTIRFARNSKNTPVVMLASGNVTLSGQINLDGASPAGPGTGGVAGSGGFDGGPAGSPFEGGYSGTAGDGPGGGGAGVSPNGSSSGAGGGAGFLTNGATASGTNAGAGGPRYGTPSLIPLLGGSGGGGGAASALNPGGGGGGGGGALLIASSAAITLGPNAIISAGGAAGGGASGGAGQGGSGSGGAIRLVANTISGNGEGGAGPLRVRSNGANGNGGLGAGGYVRVEASDLTSFNPILFSPISFGIPNPALLPATPQIRIASVAGVNAPAMPAGSLHKAPDMVISSSTPNPIGVSLEASNVPVGTVVQLTVTASSGARTSVSSTPLAGTQLASTATASATVLSGISVLSATATIDLTVASAAPMLLEGEPVDRIEVAAVYGGTSELTYVTRSGKRIQQ